LRLPRPSRFLSANRAPCHPARVRQPLLASARDTRCALLNRQRPRTGYTRMISATRRGGVLMLQRSCLVRCRRSPVGNRDGESDRHDRNRLGGSETASRIAEIKRTRVRSAVIITTKVATADDRPS
jgi:hypothetical protein